MKETIIKCDRCGNVTKAQRRMSKRGYSVCKDLGEILDLCDQCLDSLDGWIAKSVWMPEEVDDGK